MWDRRCLEDLWRPLKTFVDLWRSFLVSIQGLQYVGSTLSWGLITDWHSTGSPACLGTKPKRPEPGSFGEIKWVDIFYFSRECHSNKNPRDQNQGVYRKLNERKSSVLAEMSLNKTQETRIREFLENQLRWVESRDAIIIKAKTYISWQKNNSRSF